MCPFRYVLVAITIISLYISCCKKEKKNKIV